MDKLDCLKKSIQEKVRKKPGWEKAIVTVEVVKHDTP